MPDDAQNPHDASQADSDVQPAANDPKPKSFVRQIILFLFLAVAIVAMGLDRMVARPKSTAAFEAIQDAADEQALEVGGGLDQSEVEVITGRKPATVVDGKRFRQARYSWRGGLPWRTYDVWVVYQPVEDKFLYRSVFYNEPPPSNLAD